MPERRMFAKTIIDSDAFIDMPLSTQALYFHLSMRADDDGFINNPKKIQRMIGCSEDDLKLLIAKNFIIPFESGIVVIKHWKIHNLIKGDRYKATVYGEEKALLSVKENGAYTLNAPTKEEVGLQSGTQMEPEWNQNGTQMEPQVRLGKVSIGKVNNVSKKEGTNSSYEDILNEFVISDELKTVIFDFIKMRRLIKKPMTNRALKLLINRVRELASDETEQIKILNQSIANSWQGVFPLKDDSSNSRFGNQSKHNLALDYEQREYTDDDLNKYFMDLTGKGGD